ncbi:MAG: PqiC family protein, partial [Acidobacteriota bacterium]|nr:PqiC family protein [Acidobacteriota bacterium]
RKEVVVRKANNQLDVRPTQQWSATLGQLVMHTLAFDVADRLPAGTSRFRFRRSMARMSRPG